MRILSMTATFGKLEHETLTLEPGLNILEAPNEWGKSTWCAFLVSMLYGLDTRAKSTKASLADKERYAPWSGTPMAGRMDIIWRGRKITIERTTKRRVPLGEFRAYETETGLSVPELTAANCGEMLLGAEQSVFRRAGFIRLADMPVTQDEALRHRLNALVTTGDDSGEAENLLRQLRELKNRCRYNRTGLLPQAEQSRREVQEKLLDMTELEQLRFSARQQLEQVTLERQQLENHSQALAYRAAQEDRRRLEAALLEQTVCRQRLEKLEQQLSQCLPREQAQEKLEQLQQLSCRWNEYLEEQAALAQPPQPPQIPECYQQEQTIRRDILAYKKLMGSGVWGFCLAFAVLALAAAGLGIAGLWVWTGIAGALALAALVTGLVIRGKRTRSRLALQRCYGAEDPDIWLQRFAYYSNLREVYREELFTYRQQQTALEEKQAQLRVQRRDLLRGLSAEDAAQQWQQSLRMWDAYSEALRDAQRSTQHADALRAVARSAEPPRQEDLLDCSEEQTRIRLADALAEQHRLQNLLGQYQGRIEALGSRQQLQQELEGLNRRIDALEDTYSALTVALQTLEEARLELQRRFAPRIARRARELMGRFTNGRYERLTLDQDFGLRTGAVGEDTLRTAQWRSDGTGDQLYLALRLAVAEELTPHAPLVLDDALVRFDDERLKAVLKILQELSQHRQVLLFTCQSREKQLLEE